MIRTIYRLAKLSVNVFIGYACYEFVRGLIDGGSSSAGGGRTKEPYRTHWDDVVRESDSRAMSGQAPVVRTEESSGGSSTQAVGRGVVSR